MPPDQQATHQHDRAQHRVDTKQQSVIKRCEDRSHQRRQRGIAEGVGDHQPGHQRRQSEPAVDAEQDAERGRHALAADEAEEYRPQVSEKYRQRDQCDADLRHAEARGEMLRHPDREPALGAIADQRRDRRPLVTAAQDIRRAGIFRSVGARIGQAPRATDDDGEGDGADHVGGDNEKQGWHAVPYEGVVRITQGRPRRSRPESAAAMQPMTAARSRPDSRADRH